MNDQQIFELTDRLKAAKEMKRELEDKVKEVNREIEEVDAALSDKIAEEEVDKFSRNGSTFYLNSRLYASAQAGRKEDLISALKKNEYGDIVTETVNANSLSSFVKEQMAQHEDTIPEWLDDVVNAFEKVTVGIRKG